jgi:hypothetical protein
VFRRDQTCLCVDGRDRVSPLALKCGNHFHAAESGRRWDEMSLSIPDLCPCAIQSRSFELPYGSFFTTQVGPELYRQTGTFVDTESEIRAKRLPDCLPVGGSQIVLAFLKRIFDFEARSPRVGQITSIEAAGRSDRASDLAYGQTVRNHLLSV